MSDGYLIPEAWAIPLTAHALECPEEEVRALIESGVIRMDDYRTIEAEQDRRWFGEREDAS